MRWRFDGYQNGERLGRSLFSNNNLSRLSLVGLLYFHAHKGLSRLAESAEECVECIQHGARHNSQLVNTIITNLEEVETAS